MCIKLLRDLNADLILFHFVKKEKEKQNRNTKMYEKQKNTKPILFKLLEQQF